MTMYHGTLSIDQIVSDGFLRGPVYLTPDKNLAEDYAANNSPDYSVIEMEIAESLFVADREFVKSGGGVQESLENGSIRLESDLILENVKITNYIDYEEVE